MNDDLFIELPDFLISNLKTELVSTESDDSDQITCTLYTCSSDSGCSADGGCSGYTCSSDSPSSRPNDWTWTQTELNSFNRVVGYYVSDLTYLRWNAFVDRVNDFRVYKGLSTVNSAAYMTTYDKQLTATRFNLVRLAIGSMYSTGITDRVAGDPVYGSYFITLRDSLNSIT